MKAQAQPLALGRARAVTPGRTTAAARIAEPRELAFVLLQIPIGLAMDGSPALATAHVLAVLGIGLFWATRRRTAHRVLYAAFYAASCGVLWRMTPADTFWETGKYALVLLLGIAWLRLPHARRSRFSGLLFLLLLLPSAVVTFADVGSWHRLRQLLSFNLSGPLTLAVAVFALPSLRLRPQQMRRLLVALAAPAVAVVAIATRSTLLTPSLSFSAHSNFLTSGDFGPNQVSALLSLGALAALLLALDSESQRIRWWWAGLAGWLSLQCVLTFSRGGAFNLVVAAGALVVHLVRQRRLRLALLSLLLFATLAGTFALPRLNAWTGGALGQRFSDINTTGRTSLAREDLRLFLNQPLLGVGPGMSPIRRLESTGRIVAPHTEYTRLLAEHGVFGLAALLLLLGLLAQAYLRRRHGLPRGWLATLALWSLAEMSHAAMRIAPIGLLIGLALVEWPSREGAKERDGA